MFRGVDEKAVYQRRSYENIDLIPNIAELLEEDGINKKHLFMSREEKLILVDILASFSLRERRCYILREGQKMSMAKIADELEITKRIMQHYVERARKKVAEKVS